jgi:FtsP/CotA-like multicopper oxidase with cupredoxin domain
LLLSTLLFAGCKDGPGAGGGRDGTGDSINPIVLEDINPDEDIVEINLSAEVAQIEYIDGVATTAWTYNGVIGPVIEAKLGDTLIVHFENNLPEGNETTVHWHGVEVPANMDGSVLAQTPVPAGGKLTYEFELTRASLFWFHPHVRGNEQIELGLQGLLVVHDAAQDEALALPKREHWLILDDVLLEDGQVAPPYPADPLQNAMTQVNGRTGNTLLVNGKVGQELEVQIGRPQRLRMVNTSNSRFMRLSIPGHTLYRIGGDQGLLEHVLALREIEQVEVDGAMMSDPDPSKGLILTPGERADLIFIPEGNEGDAVPLEWHDMARGRHKATVEPNNLIVYSDDETDGTLPPETLMTFKLRDLGPVDDDSVPDDLEPLTPVMHEEVPPEDFIRIMFGHTLPDEDGNIDSFAAMTMVDMMMVGIPFADFTPEMAPTVVANEVRVIEVVNNTAGAHNFHLHGFMFQHIETVLVDDQEMTMEVIPAKVLENKDTIIVPARPGGMGTSRSITRLAVEFSDAGREGQIFAAGKLPGPGTSGGWLYHCHMLEHLDRGMGGFLQVVPAP